MTDEQKRVILQVIAQAKTTSHAWDAVNSILSTHAAPAPNPSDKQGAVYYRYRHSEGEKWHYGPTPQNWWECQALGVLAQSAEQDRIDAERWRHAMTEGFISEDDFCKIVEGASND